MRNVSSLETVARDYQPLGVQFFYIYKALAHPEYNGYVTPYTQQERLMHVAEAKRKIPTRISWLCDTMQNDLKHALGDAPNSEFLIGPDGKILQVRRWSDPVQLRDDLEALFGPVARPTTVEDLGWPPLERPRTAPTGVVPRLEIARRMMPLQVQPREDLNQPAGEPCYVKLRAELARPNARGGRGNGGPGRGGPGGGGPGNGPRGDKLRGKLYIGFFLDPLYHVHWNNLVEPVSFEVQAPEGCTVTPSRGQGPRVEEPADADPREFLLDLSASPGDTFQVTVRYFACDDAQTFCKAMTQVYSITIRPDRDGGQRRIPRRAAGPP